jgi:hypothetical protein
MTVAAVDRLVGGRNTLSGLFSPVPMAGCAANGWFGERVDGWARLAGSQCWEVAWGGPGAKGHLLREPCGIVGL